MVSIDISSNSVVFILNNVVSSGIYLKWLVYLLLIIVFNIMFIEKSEKSVLLIILDICRLVVIFGSNIFYKRNNLLIRKKLVKIMMVVGSWFI